MKNLSTAIGLHIELSILPTTLRQMKAHTWPGWDRIDGIISPIYIPVRETTIEQVEHEKDHKR
jgi:hypothetical protein